MKIMFTQAQRSFVSCVLGALILSLIGFWMPWSILGQAIERFIRALTLPAFVQVIMIKGITYFAIIDSSILRGGYDLIHAHLIFFGVLGCTWLGTLICMKVKGLNLKMIIPTFGPKNNSDNGLFMIMLLCFTIMSVFALMLSVGGGIEDSYVAQQWDQAISQSSSHLTTDNKTWNHNICDDHHEKWSDFCAYASDIHIEHRPPSSWSAYPDQHPMALIHFYTKNGTALDFQSCRKLLSKPLVHLRWVQSQNGKPMTSQDCGLINSMTLVEPLSK